MIIYICSNCALGDCLIMSTKCDNLVATEWFFKQKESKPKDGTSPWGNSKCSSSWKKLKNYKIIFKKNKKKKK